MARILTPNGATFLPKGTRGGYAYLWQYVPNLPTPTAWWQPKSDSYGLWVPADIATSYVNVANPGTYDAAPGTAPAWAAATGWTGDGTKYLTTTWTPPGVDVSLLACFSGCTGTDRCAAGSYGGLTTNSLFLLPANATGALHGYANGDAVYGVNTLAAGCMLVAGANTYLDGAPDTAALTPVAFAGGALYLLALNASGAAWIFSGVVTLVAAWESDISAYAASLYTVLQGAGLTS